MKAKISKTAKDFIKYEFHGNGQYHTTEYGSRAYRNTMFTNFLNYNKDCVNVISEGNDAPRGGRIGDFVVVEFNKNFYEKYGWYLDHLENEEKVAKKAEAEKQALIDAIGDQSKLLADYLKNHPDFAEKLRNRIENYPSKEWRNWVRMKVAQKITNERFDLLTLTAAEIRDLVYSV